MKTRIQLTPALMIAVVCALGWFALWLAIFQPIPEPSVPVADRPSVAVSPPVDETFRTLRTPTLFALPSEKGFSGTFPSNQVHHVDIDPKPPTRPETYLRRRPVATSTPEQAKLIESIPLPQRELPRPCTGRTATHRQPDRIMLFFSPKLQSRVLKTDSLDKIKDLPEASIRIHLSIRPNGTVAHAFFENPIQQPSLLSDIRRLRFNPASEKTEGWLDIRFTPPSGGNS